jgi:uncharacterized membrane protein YqaE (UPF0057 family)
MALHAHCFGFDFSLFIGVFWFLHAFFIPFPSVFLREGQLLAILLTPARTF